MSLHLSVASPHTEVSEDFENMMNELKHRNIDQNPFTFQVCVSRNILLLGRTRTGKSTIAKVIENNLHIPELRRLYAETRKIHFNRIAGECDGIMYHFNIIDSPGLFDLAQNGTEALTNERIQEIIDDCIKKDVTDIHAFGFVFSAEGGINQEDIQSMILVQNRYPLLRNYMMLVITHGEEKDGHERSSFVEEFFKQKDVVKHGLKDFFGLGTFFIGCLRPQLKRYPNLEAALIQLRNVSEMRQTFIRFLMKQENRFNIHRYHEENTTARNIQPISVVATRSTPEQASGIIRGILFLSIILLIFFYLFSTPKAPASD